MTGTAARTDVYVGYYGDGTTHWHIDPPLDGHDHILICDRTALVGLGHVAEEMDYAAFGITVETKIPSPIEVFPADEDGQIVGDHMDTIAEPVSLLRVRDGIDLTRALAQLGYTEAT